MAMQTDMGLSKIVILVGAGYTRTILVKNGASVSDGGPATGLSKIDNCNMTSLIVPAAAVGALCYGCMWWKGLTFSDFMYVTKRNMANAVSNLTKHLESVSEALAVTDVRGDLSQIGFDLDALQRMVSGLDGKICSLEDKQDLANLGVLYLCNFVDGRKVKMPEVLQEQLKLSGKPVGLKEIADSLVSKNANRTTSTKG
ncbi:hypothetical protein ACSBR1_029673 [Camellia fascicularis]